MNINPISLNFVQGEDLSYEIQLFQDAGVTPVVLTGATITSSIRKEYNQSVLASFTIEETDLSIGKFTLKLSGALTTALPANSTGRITSYVWDVDVLYSDGTNKTPVYGYLKAQKQVTV